MRHASIAVAREFFADIDDALVQNFFPRRRTAGAVIVGRTCQLHRSTSSRDGETFGPLTIELLERLASLGRRAQRTPFFKRSFSIVSWPTLRSSSAILPS